jgi:WD40 repeat protein
MLSRRETGLVLNEPSVDKDWSSCLQTLEGHSGPVNSTAWSQDGNRLASAPSDDTVRLWDPATGQCALTIHVNSPDFVQFDTVNFNHLHTSTGTFDIGYTAAATLAPKSSTSEQYGYGLNDDYSWITYNGVNLLWLPAEYRPADSSLFAMSATNLAIACSSGVVIFLALTEQSPIPGL